ncbi:hypothetical protein [Sphingomonas sp. 67-41]|jgi:hypothetical protein|uniref:hypothetical protein n=1 Tax=Sphingomonas TaxID=13687 RepID=UPI00095E33D1|nr:hypothetical protein [Sphingomonas sp. 67-41]OJY53863.1 MAG: hypothetical protein BGP17_07430 [Sphingomonas sp. 67-41]
MKNTSLSVFAAAAMLLAPIPAFAFQGAPAETVQARKNQVLIDADGRNLGKVKEVNSAAGYVTFTSNMKLYRVPLSSLSADGAKLKTTLTRAQIGL